MSRVSGFLPKVATLHPERSLWRCKQWRAVTRGGGSRARRCKIVFVSSYFLFFSHITGWGEWRFMKGGHEAARAWPSVVAEDWWREDDLTNGGNIFGYFAVKSKWLWNWHNYQSSGPDFSPYSTWWDNLPSQSKLNTSVLLFINITKYTTTPGSNYIILYNPSTS